MRSILTTKIGIFLFETSFKLRKQAVNFINILCTNFSYARHFGSIFCIQVTRKKAAKMTTLQNIRTFDIDEIDTRRSRKNQKYFSKQRGQSETIKNRSH